MQKKTARLLLFVFAFVIFGASLWQVYLIRDGSYAACYSRENEAYLFLAGSHTGFRFRAITYPFRLGLGYLFGGYVAAGLSERNDEQPSLIVLHITPASLEQEVDELNEKDQDASFITPFSDGLYGMCPGSVLCKWTGKRFEPATTEQLKSVGGSENLVRGSTENQPVNGWLITKTYAVGQHEIPIGKDITVIMENHGQTGGIYNWITVDILRTGRPIERVYDVDDRKLKLVSKATYDEIFAAQHAAK
jgi:hypothetical protein